MHINQNFDSGNILVKDIQNNSATLAIRTDTNSEFKQWFHFKLNGKVGDSYDFVVANASECSYEKGWDNYQVAASYDGDYWFRIDTQYEAKQLKFKHTLEHNSIFFAYFAPYSYQRHQQLIHNAQHSALCQHLVLGETVQGRTIDLLQIGDANKKPLWVTARQHPGETMAEWCAEGLIDQLLDDNNAVARKMLNEYCFYIVPNMNPDGSVNGNLRSNYAGANLNREWMEPSIEKSPEVFYVRQKMQKTGVAGYLDLHGDEGLPYIFVAGCEGNPSFNEALAQQEANFSENLKLINPDFQTEYGYPKDEPGKANLTVASNWVGENFNCLALTLEMPFKDNANISDADTGWSPERSYILGGSLLTALFQTLS